ncbi:endoplasmic reticulum vesicle transporter-domain-containing protein [Tuber indicum]|nr:endoplasmic reticulum vesicle transporter-domain-containing protein [Tuber indicum]
MNEEFFGEKRTSLGESVRTFDAFPKTRATYTTRTPRGGAITLLLLLASACLTLTELRNYLTGSESHTFMVEPGIGHDMQINLDITVAMPCSSLHLNVQDAMQDRILAGQLLSREEVRFDDAGAHKLYSEGADADAETERRLFSSLVGKGAGEGGGSCRIYGSMGVNRILGDFHITAKGHGYWEDGAHIDHRSFNFSHVITELSFGDYYPKLVNPLDGVVSKTDENFHKFQYFLSIVPTTYESQTSGKSLLTNQYAVTEQSRKISSHFVPGIYFKYDIEPISLKISDRRTALLAFVVRLVNIVSGILVGGGWVYGLFGTLAGYFRRQRRRTDGMLNGRALGDEE